MTDFTPIIIALFGIIFGSFIGAASYRIPRQIGIGFTRSHCPYCKHTLAAKDLIPILSWLCTLGKCRYCHTTISMRYTLIEISTATLCVITYLHAGLSPQGVVLLAVTLCLITIIVIDLEHQIIPFSLQQLLLLLAMMHWAITGTPNIPDLLIGLTLAIILGYGLRAAGLKFLHKEILGLGDANFFIICAVFLGGPLFPLFLFIAGLTGTISGLCWKTITKNPEFPFAPALCIALYICLLYPQLLDIFMHSIGQLLLAQII